MKLKIDGISEVTKALAGVPAKLRKAEKAAARKVGQGVVKTAKANAGAISKRRTVRIGGSRQAVYGSTGALKKGIGYRVGVHKKRGHVYVVIGVRSQKSQAMRSGKLVNVNPAYYAHLVEYGSIRSAAKPFLRPAISGVGAIAEKATKEALDAVR